MVNATRWVCTRCRPYACRDPYRRVLNDISHQQLCLVMRSLPWRCASCPRDGTVNASHVQLDRACWARLALI